LKTPTIRDFRLIIAQQAQISHEKPLLSPHYILGQDEPDLSWPDISLGPIKFVPRDGGLFSNINHLAGEISIGRQVYPVWNQRTLSELNTQIKHFAYISPYVSNSWHEFFEPLKYSPTDSAHFDEEYLETLSTTGGGLAPPEFRLPRATFILFNRPDFQDWREAIHQRLDGILRPIAAIRDTISRLTDKMEGLRIAVHVRHPSHMVEGGEVYLQSYFDQIDSLRSTSSKSSIFLATESELPVAAFKHRYGNSLFYYPDFLRTPIDDVLAWAYSLAKYKMDNMGFVGGVGYQLHYKIVAAGDPESGIRAGKEAVTDLFTLAACDHFVCTASNFTLACAYLNPKQEQHLVSKGA
jgi:hypothetical protein